VRARDVTLVAVLLWACGESTTAPGACPEYCPPARLEVVDTVLQAVFDTEEWFSGYVNPHEAVALQVLSDGIGEVSRAVVRFPAFSSEIAVDGALVPISEVDSFRLRLRIARRTDAVQDPELLVYRLPVSVDSGSTFADLEPYFADSTLLARILVPLDSIVPPDTPGGDSVTVVVDTVGVTLPVTAFPTLDADSLQTAVGIALRGDQAGYVDLGSREGSTGPSYMSWFVKVDSSGTPVERQEARIPAFDGFVVADQPAVPEDALAVGGAPSARTFLRVALPDSIMKYSNIVRADLLLVPEAPVLGGVGDTVTVTVNTVEGDYGPKSKPRALPTDSVSRGFVNLPVGSRDTVRIDITTLLVAWQPDTTLPRTILLRIVPEGATLGELRVYSSRSAVGKPALHLTYVPFFSTEELLP
jgi:hypothetical protein